MPMALFLSPLQLYPKQKWFLSVLLLLISCFSLTSTANAKIHFPPLNVGPENQDCGAGGEDGDMTCSVPPALVGNNGDLFTATIARPLFLALQAVVWYKPPVGIVTVWTCTRWLVKQAKAIKSNGGGDTSEQALVQKASRLDHHSGRALDLDGDDLAYQKFGGIERVRRRLAYKALERAVAEQEQLQVNNGDKGDDGDSAGFNAIQNLATSLMTVLHLSFPPGGSHSDYVQRLLKPMAQVEQAMLALSGNKGIKPNTSNIIDPRLLVLSFQTAELRVLDALLRLTRDRLIRSSFRLSRNVQHWRRRVHAQSLIMPIFRSIMAQSFEGDRMRLAFAEAAYQSEIIRLGKVVHILMERPMGMQDTNLSLAVQKTLELEKMGPKNKGDFFLRVPKIYNFEIRFNTDGRGKFSFKTYDDSMTVGGAGALQVLLEKYNTIQQPWLQQSKAWSLQVRQVLYDIVEEALQTSVQNTDAELMELSKLKTSWCTQQYDPRNPQVIPKQWNTMLAMIRTLHQLRQVGEGKSVKWKDANFVHWFRQWDLLGIPSAGLQIYLAFVAHTYLKPHWPKLQSVLKESFEVTNEIIQTRFWIPFRDLLTELMYRETTKLMTGFSLHDEEVSLDNMLKDSNFGDGAPESRQQAILKATRQYESDMKSGLLWHGNRLVKLILIQVQQLKVGLLHATDTVDVLLQANRFNIQLLAVIPAIIIVTLGTKIFFRTLYTLRVKDIRPISTVHAEMTEYLSQLESVVLLATERGGNSNKQKSSLVANQVLNHRELGEFVSILYDYLVLLDYSSPKPFPKWQCDGIHQSIAEFLGPEGSFTRMSLDDQVKLIDQVKRKHNDLANHL